MRFPAAALAILLPAFAPQDDALEMKWEFGADDRFDLKWTFQETRRQEPGVGAVIEIFDRREVEAELAPKDDPPGVLGVTLKKITWTQGTQDYYVTAVYSEGKPLDAFEFAVHLGQARDDRVPDVYRKPEQFFERTYLTQSLTDLAAQVIRRLSGETTETSAVFNMATQFGGGKTHALTLLFHLATYGPAANGWMGVRRLLGQSGMSRVPQAAVAVFVGTEFDSLSGRGGDDGTPVRKTPWGEIAFQLGGVEALQRGAEGRRCRQPDPRGSRHPAGLLVPSRVGQDGGGHVEVTAGQAGGRSAALRGRDGNRELRSQVVRLVDNIVDR